MELTQYKAQCFVHNWVEGGDGGIVTKCPLLKLFKESISLVSYFYNNLGRIF